MKARRSSPPTVRSNVLLVTGIGFVPPVAWGLLRGTLDLTEFLLITTVVLVAAGITYLLSARAYRGRAGH
ncbi:hypothetical protein GCM10027270_29250 [Nocardioides ginkgobilobae]